MQLVYRGISYQTPSIHIAADQQKINGKYRGIPYQNQIKRKKSAAISSVYALKYRGIDYIKTLN